MTDSLKVILLSLRDIDPLLRDGASRTLIERLNILQRFGCNVSLINFLPDETYNRQAMREMLSEERGLDFSRTKDFNQIDVAGIKAWHELLPYRYNQLSENYPRLLKIFIQKLENSEPDFVFTCGESLLPLAAFKLLGISGAHSFHSLVNVENCAANPTFTRFLRQGLVFTVSKYLQGQIRKKMGIESIVWHPYIDLCHEEEKSLKQVAPSGVTFDIGFNAGGWTKGDPIVERIVKRMPEYSFLIVGGNPLSHAYETYKNVTFLGWISDMQSFFRRIRVLLVPSLVCEGFARVILEGASFGIPVIANRLGGIPEAMGQSGILVNVNNEHDLDLDGIVERYVVEIRHLLENKTIYQEYHNRALDRVYEYILEEKEVSRSFYYKYFSIR